MILKRIPPEIKTLKKIKTTNVPQYNCFINCNCNVLSYTVKSSLSYIWCEIWLIGLKSSKLDLSYFSLSSTLEASSTVRVKNQWTGTIERTMAYISFFLPFGVLKFDMIVSVVITFCLLWETARNFKFNTYFYIFLRSFKRVGSVLFSPELHVVPSFFMWYYALLRKGLKRANTLLNLL